MKKKILILLVIGIFVLAISSPVAYYFIKLPISIYSLSYGSLNEDDTKTLKVDVDNAFFDSKCSIDGVNWIEVKDGSCSFDVVDGDYTVNVKNQFTHFSEGIKVSINDVKAIKFNTLEYYLAIDEEYQIRTETETIGENVDTTLSWTSSDPSIVSVEDGKIRGIKEGTVKVTAKASNGVSSSLEVTVTHLIIKREINNKKKIIPCNAYTQEEATLLDKILETRIAAEGIGSRQAEIEALRFLTLSLEYKIPYFFEHGRLNGFDGQRITDGEGRYYHKGLYLSEDKYQFLTKPHCKPRMWGCGLTNYDDLYQWTIGAKYPNGLDCSGFISWSFLNSGHDVKDVGSGFNDHAYDLSDLGTHHDLTYKYMNEGNYKVGDMIGWNGHVGMIAGKDDTYIYIAESLSKGVRINKQSYKDAGSDLYKDYSYVGILDDFYTDNTVYSELW